MIVRALQASSGASRKLIGEAWVRDIMHGEAVKAMKAEGKSWEETCIV